MKKLIANWKQNKSEEEVKYWFDSFYSKINLSQPIELIIAPAFVYLPLAKRYASTGNLHVSAQNMSPYSNGPYTGQVGAQQIKQYAEFVIIGHSECRSMGESHEAISEKIIIAQSVGIIPIICFSSIPEYIRAAKSVDMTKQHFFAYEPIESIGTRNPASIQSIKEICKEIGLSKVIYGGSVDIDSIMEYLDYDLIEGFLVGSASLDPDNFYNLAKIISTYLPQ